MKTWTTANFKACKGQRKLGCITAYDCTFARLADAANVPLILVGDSLGMTMLGYDSTLPVTMDQMISHTAAVARGVTKNSIVIGDMPFLSYQASVEDGVRNAGRFLQEAHADGVKLEGFYPELVEKLVRTGIPVVGHLGMTPQSFNVYGGFKVQAKTQEAGEELIRQAQQLCDAGAFAITLECVPPDIAKAVTESVSCSTIGIGAGPDCDAQFLVMQDLLGMTEQSPKFVKRFANLGMEIQSAFAAYVSEVANGTFPAQEHCYKPAGFQGSGRE
ncbi:MAG: 3-methyl-2-oxobutanoate hydroxymethyltransferase [Kiritimatiellae bacterium]|nr:3-methyl-2-oxobutanoate hydroxymethyltransferase [Kiritimatiellia bacterium]